MNRHRHTEKAFALYREGFSCSQAIFGAFAPEYDLNRETAFKIGDSFSGGMGRLGNTCGAGAKRVTIIKSWVIARSLLNYHQIIPQSSSGRLLPAS